MAEKGIVDIIMDDMSAQDAGLERKPDVTDVIKEVNEVRSTIPAVTHVDYSARIQTVDKKRHGYLYDLLKEYKRLTKCSVLVNTSFNVRGEPIVYNPKDAYNCFMLTDMDYLVMGNYILDKKEQSEWSDD